MATCRRFQATFLVALLALHASFVTGRINQDDPSIRGGPLLIGEWTALKGRIVSVPEESAQSSAGSIQMELEKEGAVLKGSFTGFVPGTLTRTSIS